MNVQGKGCLVSGGASGLGAATTRALVAKGAKVVIADRAKDAGLALAHELGDAVAFAECDVTDETTVKAAVDLAVSKFGSLSIVAGCAGIGFAGRVLGKDGPMPLDWFKKTVEVNLVGMFNLARLSAAAMQSNQPDGEGERGVIVFTASVAAYDGQIGQAAYSASKSGVVGMTLPIARELARFGIRVLTIAPGIFDTPMLAALPEEARKSLGAQVPFPPRLGRPDEFAALVCHIAENTMLNGETIRLDGAIRMAAK